MAEMNDNDIERDIVGTYMMYKGRLVYVLSNDRAKLRVRYMDTMVEAYVLLNFENLKAIRGRVGMVNAGGYVGYATRTPMRKMQVGMTWRNTTMYLVCKRKDREQQAYDDLRNNRGVSLSDAVRNIYPKLPEAFAIAKETTGGCAFDKQFAIDYTGAIYYKDQGVVGSTPITCKLSIDKIVLLDKYSHLQPLLEKDYDKTVRTFSA